MATRRNPQPSVIVTADDEEVASGNPLPVTAGTGDNVIGRVKITDGTDVALVTTAGSLNINIAEGGGSVGGGTQYTEGDTDASITGTVMMMEGAGDALVAAQGTAANGLEVDVTRVTGTVTVDGSGVTQPVSGTVTANLSATDNAVLDAIEADTTTIAGAVSGTEMQVDVVTSALPTGAATSALQGGGLPAALGAGGGLKVDGSGTALPVSLASVPSHAVTNAGTFAVQVDGAALTALQLIDNIVGSINGPGAPTIDSYTQASFNLTAAADQVLVSSAASKQIWVYAIGFVLSAAGTVSFQDEDNVAITGIMPFAANSGMSIGPSGNFAMPLWKLGTDKDFEVDLVTAEMDGWVTYAIVSV